MNLVKVKCAFCGREYFRQAGRVNEARKFGWNQYCSMECQKRARTTKVERKCGNPDCHKKVLRQLNQFKNSKSGFIFCSQSCAAIFNNKKCLKGHAKIKPKLKTCLRCGKQFRKNKGNLKYCSIKCRRATPQQLLEIIKRTAQELKRVPARRELEGIATMCAKTFGSWNNAIAAAGLPPNRSHSQRMYKRTNTVALDGHLCDSVSEALIDNWLTENNISHERNVSYPETNHKADWKININGQAVFIEYFGLANDSPRYDRTTKKKQKLSQRYNFKLIEIYPQDLYPKEHLDDKLKDKFRSFTGVQFEKIQDAGDRTQTPATRTLCTTIILHPDRI